VVAQAIAWPATPCRPFLAYAGVRHVSFSADSKMVATASDDNTAKLHDSNLDGKDHLGSLVLSLQKRDLLTAFGWLPIPDVCVWLLHKRPRWALG